MARFMMFIYPDARPEEDSGSPSPPRTSSPMIRPTTPSSRRRRRAAGARTGCFPDTHASIITWSEGKTTVTDGPFAEAKELVGGYWVIQAKTSTRPRVGLARPDRRGPEVVEMRQIRECGLPEEVQAVGRLTERPPGQTVE